MERRIWKNLLGFVLALALTVGTVAALSMVTAAKTETAPARYSQEVRKSQAPVAEELSAAEPKDGLSTAASVGAFAMILAIPALGVFLFQKSRKKGRRPAEPQGRRRYSPRADMAFQNAAAAKRV